MLNRIGLLAGLVLLASGTALADAQGTSDDREKIAPVEASAPATNGAVEREDASRAAKEPQQELHPDAKPVYSNGGYFGGRQ